MHRTTARDHGFSLLELLTVVAIIGILLTVAIAVFTSSIERTNRITCVSNQRTLESAIQVYRAENDSVDPTSVDDLVPYVSGTTIPRCPSDSAVSLVLIPATGTITCPNHP